jgi:hypothetical protein
MTATHTILAVNSLADGFDEAAASIRKLYEDSTDVVDGELFLALVIKKPKETTSDQAAASLEEPRIPEIRQTGDLPDPDGEE